jgi:uncharacterized iron-regulated membrane protein
MIVRRTFVALAVAVVLAAIPTAASAGSPPAASYYTKQQLETMSQSWAAKAALSSPTRANKALLARITAANAGDSDRPAASYYTKQQLETMRESWQAKAVASLRQNDASSSADFAWGDFGIGAAGMLGLVLLLGGVIVAVRHRRRSTGFAAHRTA